jgi:hypothetical protein
MLPQAERPSWSEMLQSADLSLKTILLSLARFDQQSNEPATQKLFITKGDVPSDWGLMPTAWTTERRDDLWSFCCEAEAQRLSCQIRPSRLTSPLIL